MSITLPSKGNLINVLSAEAVFFLWFCFDAGTRSLFSEAVSRDRLRCFRYVTDIFALYFITAVP